MSALALARKEMRLHRFGTAALLCFGSLALLGAATLVPRTWTCTAVIGIDADPAAVNVLGDHLVERLLAGGVPGHIEAEALGSEVHLRVTGSSETEAGESINSLLARLVADEVSALRARMQQNESALTAQVEEAQARVAEAEQKLAAAQRDLPAGGESALGARIGQLEGERDALALDLRGSNELKAKLMVRIVDLDREIAALHGAPPLQQEVAQQRIDTDLRPQRNQAATRLATLRDEISVKERRRREVAALLERQHAQAAGVVQGSQAVRELQRAYDDAALMHRQQRVRLQEVREDIAVRATAATLPFRITRRPIVPAHPDGIPGWLLVAAALGGGALLATARLLGRVLVDDRVRLADTIVIDAEVPVLAIVADHRPPQAAMQVRWAPIATALLGTLVVAACLLFVVWYG